MSDDKGKHFGVSEVVEKSFNGISNLRPIHIETIGPVGGVNSDIITDPGSSPTQNTSSESGE